MLITRWSSIRNPQGVSYDINHEAFLHWTRRPKTVTSKLDLPGYALVKFRNNYRSSDNVEAVYAITLDDDSGGRNVEATVDAWGNYAGVVHSTFSSTPEHPRTRTTIFVTRPMSAEEYRIVWRFVQLQALANGIKLDESPKDPSRLWFEPGIPPDSAFYYCELGGAPLDVDVVLRGQVVRDAHERTLGGHAETFNKLAQSEPYPGDITDAKEISRRAGMLSEICQQTSGASEGDRYHTVFPLVQRGAWHFRLPAEVVLQTIAQHWNPRCSPPWDESKLREQVMKHVSSARRYSRVPLTEPMRLDWSDVVGSDVSNSGGSNVPGLGAKTYALTDTGNAERFADQHRDQARYVGKWKTWVLWDGKRWRRDDGCAVNLLAKATARALDDELRVCLDDDRRKRLRAHATRSESRAGIENMVALARGELTAEPEDFDSDCMLLNVENGTIDLRTGLLKPHTRVDMLTMLAPVNFDPGTKAPLWEEFLHKVMSGNERLISYLQRVVGYSLTGDVSEHAMFFSYGGGDNGKGVFHNTISELLGAYSSKAPRGVLYESRGDRHPTELADLFGSRFVLCSEVKQGQRFDESMIKDIVGEDAVKARKMYQDFWSFRPTHKLFLCGNHKPYIRGTDDGIWRRMRLIPWLVTISDDEKDRQLKGKLLREGEGILAWAVRGCLEWQRMGLGEPPEIAAATNLYREEQDPMKDFYESKCVFEKDARVARRVLRSVYEDWCRENGSEPLGYKRFAESLKIHGVTDGGGIRSKEFKVPQDAWLGIRLRNRV